MSSRQEEKEQRKQERLEREAAAAKQAKRKRLLQLIGGVVVACAVIAGVAFAIGSGGGDGGDVDDSDLASAAQEAGCEYRSFPDEGRDHTAEELTAEDYETNPPTSGTHNPTPAPDGVYAPGNEPAIENWVHTLEHGRILFQYKPDTDPSVVTQLTRLYNEDVAGSGSAYHSVLMQNNSGMDAQVAAVAWRHYITCDEFTAQTIDAFREFRGALLDEAPEVVP